MATRISTIPNVSAADLFVATTAPSIDVGTYVESSDGRGYRYARAGAVATVAGQVYQGPAADTTNAQPAGGLATSAASIGDTSVTITTSTTNALNLFANGYMSVAVTPGAGYVYQLSGNTAVSAAANMVLTLSDPLRVALTTSSRVVICQHPYSGVLVDPGTLTSASVGVAPFVIAAGSFGYLQTYGVASVLFTGTGVTGKSVGSLVGGTAGSSAPAIAATNILGYNVSVSITAQYALIFLNIK